MHVNISLLSIDKDNDSDIFTMNMIQTEFRLCIYAVICYVVILKPTVL